jgi:hypothetical protein
MNMGVFMTKTYCGFGFSRCGLSRIIQECQVEHVQVNTEGEIMEILPISTLHNTDMDAFINKQ